MAQKSLFITYFLWLIGGFFGLHHFYLGRDYHALIWWMFAGGYFGAGWIRDLWRIPEYVKDANEDKEYIEELVKKMNRNKTPPVGTCRYFGQMLVADTFGYLVISAIPEEIVDGFYLKIFAAMLAPLAIATGIYLVGNIGRHEGRIKPAIIGAYLTFPLYFWMDNPVVITSLISTYAFNTYSKQWRRTPIRKTLAERLGFFIFFGTIYLLTWSSWLYFNCKITYQNDEVVKCRDAAKHFFKSPIFKEFVTVMKELWLSVKVHGWREVWRQIVEAFDPVGEMNALKVLGLNSEASQHEITARYRKLSREWHPDKHKSPQDKEVAYEKFIEIQQAYEILSKIKSQRVVQNIRNPSSEYSENDEL